MSKLTLEPPIYNLGELLFSPTSSVIKKEGELSKIRAKECELLRELVSMFPNVLSRENIVEHLYSNTYATDATINQLVKRLRVSIDDHDRSLILTIPKQGYQLSVCPKVVEKQSITLSTRESNVVLSNTTEDKYNRLIDKNSDITESTSNELNLKPTLFIAALLLGGLISIYCGQLLENIIESYYFEKVDYTKQPVSNASVQELIKPLAYIDGDNLKSIHLSHNGMVVSCTYEDKLTLCD